MQSMATTAMALLGLACGACGTVKDGEDRTVVCAGQPVDVLPNGNFDSPDPPWRQEPPNLLCGQPRITPDSGTASACLGGIDGATNTVSRDVPLPAGAVSAKLTGRICIDTLETEARDNDVLTIDLLDGTVPIGSLGRRTNQQGTMACSFAGFTLEAPLARDPVTATLRIQSTLDTGKPTSFYIDTLVLTASCQ
jgi:hypothetical protein